MTRTSTTGWGARLAVGLVLVALLAAGVPGRAGGRLDIPAQARLELEAGGEAEVLVVLKGRADLSVAAVQATKAARARAVVEALRATAAASQGPLLAFLEARGAEYQAFYIVNAIWVRAGEDLLAELARRPDVAAIAANPRVRGVDPDPALAPAAAPAAIEANLLRINADDVWALGFTGQGVVVAGQDTGYRWTHQALKEQYRGWDGATASHDYNWHDAIHSGGSICGADSPVPCDDHGHGTHTMGIMVGEDGTTQIGVAPGAEWIGCRNMDAGIGTPATYMECFEFFLAPYPVGGNPKDGDPALAPDVVNNSWGCPPSEGCDAAAIALLEKESVEALRAAGIIVVASAGNYGALGCGSVLDPPAIYPGSFSVGNFDHRTNLIASTSSRGPVTYGGQTYVKPDVAAPGTGILSSYYTRDDAYSTMSGTSMAAPHVAGAVALLLSAGPGLAGDVEGIEELLARTAEPKLDASCGDAGPPNNVWGWGILNALGSVSAGLVRGRAVEAGSELPLAGVRVLAEAQASLTASVETTTGISGTFSLVLPAGGYTLTADERCYGPATAAVEVAGASLTSAGDMALPPAMCAYLPLVTRE